MRMSKQKEENKSHNEKEAAPSLRPEHCKRWMWGGHEVKLQQNKETGFQSGFKHWGKKSGKEKGKRDSTEQLDNDWAETFLCKKCKSNNHLSYIYKVSNRKSSQANPRAAQGNIHRAPISCMFSHMLQGNEHTSYWERRKQDSPFIWGSAPILSVSEQIKASTHSQHCHQNWGMSEETPHSHK